MSAEERFAERMEEARTALNRLPLKWRANVVLGAFLGGDFDYLGTVIAGEKTMRTTPRRLAMNPTPRLAEGHALPTRPVNWAIQVRDADTGKVTTTRCSWNKTPSPRKASMDAFGMPPTANMTFFNLGTTLAGARKLLRTLPG